jgi:hypothetical protein
MTARCSALDGAGFCSTTRCSALDDPLLGCGAGLLDSALLGARRGACSTACCSALDVDLFDCALLCARRRAARRSTWACSTARCSALDDPLLGARRGLARQRAARRSTTRCSLLLRLLRLFLLFAATALGCRRALRCADDASTRGSALVDEQARGTSTLNLITLAPARPCCRCYGVW